MNVYQKLQQARVKLAGADMKKSGLNKFAGYKYFELADFLPIVQNIFAEIGLTGVVSFEGDRAFLRIFNQDKPEECIVIESPTAEAEMKGTLAIQRLGAVQTYLRRYLWVAALELVEHDAIDAAKPVDIAPRGSAKAAMVDSFAAMDVEEQKFLSELSVTVKAHLSEGRLDAAIKALEGLDADEKAAIWSLFDSQERAAIKAASKVAK